MLRIAVQLFAADMESGFGYFVNRMNGENVARFVGIMTNPAVDGRELDVAAMIAITVYCSN